MEAVGSAMEAVGGRTDEWGEFVEHKVTIVLPGLVDFANQFREGLEESFDGGGRFVLSPNIF